MKKFLCFLLIFVAMFIVPLNVFAEGEDGDDQPASNKVNVYFFRGEGCPHCQEAEEWFDSLDAATKEKFDIIDYETWNSQENAELMQKVAEVRGEEDSATGVPYIIIGDKSWVGFAESMKTEILNQIDAVYQQEVSERYDALSLVGVTPEKPAEEEKSSDVLSLVIVLLVVFGIGFGVYKAKQSVN